MFLWFFVIAFVVFVGMRMLLAKQRLSVKRFFIFYALAMVGVSLIYFGASGRLHWLFVLAGSALPFTGNLLKWGLGIWRTAAMLKGLRGMMGQVRQNQNPQDQTGEARKNTGQTSEVNTAFLKMVLDHDTGQMTGEVVSGSFTGSVLANLSLAELRALHGEVQADTDSTNILEAYLDREHADWRDEQTNQTQQSLTETEALEILGLEQGATDEDIKLAHRRMIQKIHPDRGGSTFLASQVNDAKDFLLKG